MSTEGTAGASYEISVEGITYPWGRDTISAAEIRDVAGLPADCTIVAVDLADGQEHVLDEDAVHHVPPLDPGKPVVKRTNFKPAETEQ